MKILFIGLLVLGCCSSFAGTVEGQFKLNEADPTEICPDEISIKRNPITNEYWYYSSRLTSQQVYLPAGLAQRVYQRRDHVFKNYKSTVDNRVEIGHASENKLSHTEYRKTLLGKRDFINFTLFVDEINSNADLVYKETSNRVRQRMGRHKKIACTYDKVN